MDLWRVKKPETLNGTFASPLAFSTWTAIAPQLLSACTARCSRIVCLFAFPQHSDANHSQKGYCQYKKKEMCGLYSGIKQLSPVNPV